MIKILQMNELADISVSDICRMAQIKRTTFHSHYNGIPELVAATLVAIIEHRLDVPNPSRLQELSSPAIAAELHATIVAAFGAIAEHRQAFRNAFNDDSSLVLRRSLMQSFRKQLEIDVGIWQNRGEALHVNEEVAFPFAAAGLTSAVETWANTDTSDTKAWADAVLDQMAPWWPRPNSGGRPASLERSFMPGGSPG